MTYAVFIALGLILTASDPPPAQAQSFAECQAWLCLPAGFSVAECSAAETAVRRRLRANMDPLPSWSSCASQFSWDAANLAWTMPTSSGCPSGYSPSGGLCRRTDSNGCRITRTRRRWANVWVWVDGVQTGTSLHHTISNGAQISRVCPPPPPEPPPTLDPPPPSTPISTDPPPWERPTTPPPEDTTTGDPLCPTPPCDDPPPPEDPEPPPPPACEVLGTCPEDDCPGGNCDEDDCPGGNCDEPEETCEDRGDCPQITCPIGWVLIDGRCQQRPHDPDNPFTPPVGPPVPGCNTISCPHVQHGWSADPLEIHWTLRAAPPLTQQ